MAVPSPVDDHGVGGLGEHLAEAAAGQHDCPAVHRADAVDLPLAHHVQGEPGDATVLVEQQVDRQRVLDDLDLGRRLDRRLQRPLDLGAGRVAAGVRDAVAVVATLAGQAQVAGNVVVEDGAELDQLADGVGPVRHEQVHRRRVTRAGSRHQGVALVLLGRVPGTEGSRDAALRPLRGAGVEHALGDHQDPARGPEPVLEPQRRGQAGDAGADHHDVAGRGPAGCWGSEAAGQSGHGC